MYMYFNKTDTMIYVQESGSPRAPSKLKLLIIKKTVNFDQNPH